MELSDFTFRIVLLFLPGLIAYFVIDRLTSHREVKFHEIVLSALVLGLLSYAAYYPLTLVAAFRLDFKILGRLTDKSVPLDFSELCVVSLLAVPLGLLLAFAENHKWLHRFAQRIRVTRKFGDLDVWSAIMSSNAEGREWVVVRDPAQDLMFEGWIELYSNANERDEFFLRDVKVFRNSSGKELYTTPGIYLPRSRNSLLVEFPRLAYTEHRSRPTPAVTRGGRHGKS